MNMPMSIAKIEIEERYLDFKGHEYRTKDELNQTSARVLLGAANEGNAAAKVFYKDEEPGLENYTTNSFEHFPRLLLLNSSAIILLQSSHRIPSKLSAVIEVLTPHCLRCS